MTTFDPPTERTGTIRLLPRHVADDATVWWFHALLTYATWLYRLSIWHIHYEWGQLYKRDRAALISALVLAVTAVAALLYH